MTIVFPPPLKPGVQIGACPDPGSVLLQWADGDGATTAVIQRLDPPQETSASRPKWTEIAEVSAGTGSYTDANSLGDGTRYRVVARNQYGDTISTNEATVTALDYSFGSFIPDLTQLPISVSGDVTIDGVTQQASGAGYIYHGAFGDEAYFSLAAPQSVLRGVGGAYSMNWNFTTTGNIGALLDPFTPTGSSLIYVEKDTLRAWHAGDKDAPDAEVVVSNAYGDRWVSLPSASIDLSASSDPNGPQFDPDSGYLVKIELSTQFRDPASPSSGKTSITLPSGYHVYSDSGASLQETTDDPASQTIVLDHDTAAAPLTLYIQAEHGAKAGEMVFGGDSINLLPAEMIVDANRDGQMSMVDPDIHDPDLTTADKPYRFWINNDYDTEYEDKEVVNGLVDSENDRIYYKRDLEDFTRLWINMKALIEMLNPDSGYTVGLRFKPLSGETWKQGDPQPSIKIFQAADTQAGGTDYVTDDDMATNQLSEDYGSAIGDVDDNTTIGTDAFIIPDDFGTDADESNPQYLIFEGVTAGKGRLVLVLIDQDNVEVAEAGAVYMDLRDIKNMYERWTVNPPQGVSANGANPMSFAQISTRDLPSYNNAVGFQYSASDPEDKKYMVFVHGRNETPQNTDMDAETSYKRLWWQGYKGRFAAFQWPTHYGIGFNADIVLNRRQAFNDDSSIAWRSAPGLMNKLADLDTQLASLPGGSRGQIYLMAHSHGNVVAGEALRLLALSGGAINTYVACEAAVPSECYDPSEKNRYPLQFPITTDSNTLDVYPDDGLGTATGWLTLNFAGVTTKVNFYNLNDFALSPYIWELNQELKPDSAWAYVPNANGNGNGTFTNNGYPYAFGDAKHPAPRYEIMSHASEPRARALGRVAGPVSGFTGGTLDMSGVAETGNTVCWTGVTGVEYGVAMWGTDPLNKHFTDQLWHNGQFSFTNMQVNKYWEQLLDVCNLNND